MVAPVLNLSGSRDVDPLKVTDHIASEFATFPSVAVVPVNRALAELMSHGKATVETPADAVALARTFGADATVVIAVTEYDPYHPPVVGLVMQWYEAPRADLPAADAPRWQLQRVFNAADEDIQHEVRDYADDRDGHRSPYGWKKYVQSQELYVRYCGWSLIRTMLRLERGTQVAQEPNEAQP